MLFKKKETIDERWFTDLNPYFHETQNSLECCEIGRRERGLSYYDRCDIVLKNCKLSDAILAEDTGHNGQALCVVSAFTEVLPYAHVNAKKLYEHEIYKISPLWHVLRSRGILLGKGTYNDCIIRDIDKKCFRADSLYVFNEETEKISSVQFLMLKQSNARYMRDRGYLEDVIERQIFNEILYAYLLPSRYGAEQIILSDFGCHRNGYSVESAAALWGSVITKTSRNLYNKVIFAIEDGKTFDAFVKGVKNE